MTYTAIDGKEFKTEQECAEWESYPTLWIHKTVCVNGYSISTEIENIFLTKEEAIKSKEILEEEDAEGIIFNVVPKIFPPFKSKRKITTVFVSNTEAKKEEKEILEKQYTAWNQIQIKLKEVIGD